MYIPGKNTGEPFFAPPLKFVEMPHRTLLQICSMERSTLHDQPPSSRTQRFIVTVTLLLCTNSTGGKPLHSKSRSSTYRTLSSSSPPAPRAGLGSVVNTTAVREPACARISSFRIMCCAREGRSLNESGRAEAVAEGLPDASRCCCCGGGACGAVGDRNRLDWEAGRVAERLASVGTVPSLAAGRA